jgi:predicted  nucleic acid-binding Zn-ribbon protein
VPDDRIRAALDRVRVSISGQLEAELTASEADLARAIEDITRQAEERLAAETASHQQTVDDLRNELSALRAESSASQDTLSGVRAELSASQDQLSGVRAALSSSQDALSSVRAELSASQDQLSAARGELDDLRQRLRDTEEQIERSRHEAEEARQLCDAARSEVGALQLELGERQRTSQRVEEQAGELRRALDELERELTAARDERQTLVSRVDRAEALGAGLRALDAAGSLGDVLDTLTTLAARAAGRAALLVVHGDRLKGWRARGFEGTFAVGGIDLDAAQSGILGGALRSGRSHEYDNGVEGDIPVFAAGAIPRQALALPVDVGGSVIALLYADVPQTDTPLVDPREPRWQTMVEIAAKYAGRVLEAMTLRHAAAIRPPLQSHRPLADGRRAVSPAGRA